MVSQSIYEAEERTWNITTPDGADRVFRRDVFRKFPERFRNALAARYLNVFNTKNVKEANLFLLDVQEKLTGQAIRLASSDDDLRLYAKRLSEECCRINARMNCLEDSFLFLSRIVESHGLTPPQIGKKITIESAVARVCDELWWRRVIRRTHGRTLEGFAISLGLVQKHADIYVSNETLMRRREQQARTQSMLRTLEAINEDGELFTLEELKNLSVSNPKHRRAELMVRLFGFEECAKLHGHIPEFYTFTCPSRMHARYAKSGDPVPNYDGTTPKEVNDYLGTVWSRIRSKLDRLKIRVYGMRVCEPMHDGTPHMHFLLYVQPEYRETLREVCRYYALEEDGDEKGADEHRFASETIDYEKGTATGYIAKYISKNTDACGLEYDLYGRDAASSAERAQTWAATWGIRQFQQIGGPPVTIWRELRKMGKQSHPVLEEIRQAADNGDWFQFVELMGGPFVARKELIVKLKRAYDATPGRYGEPLGDQIIGLEVGGITILREGHLWEIVWNPSRNGWETGPEKFRDSSETIPGASPGQGQGYPAASPGQFRDRPGSTPGASLEQEQGYPDPYPGLYQGQPGASPFPETVLVDTGIGVEGASERSGTVPEQLRRGSGTGANGQVSRMSAYQDFLKFNKPVYKPLPAGFRYWAHRAPWSSVNNCTDYLYIRIYLD